MSSEVKDKRGSCGALSAIISAVLVVLVGYVLGVPLAFVVLYTIFGPPSFIKGLLVLSVVALGIATLIFLVRLWHEEH
jgi:ABC-type spermidine/putrescine transport system permease subunit II